MCLLVLLPCFGLSNNSKSTPQLPHLVHTVFRIAIDPLYVFAGALAVFLLVKQQQQHTTAAASHTHCIPHCYCPSVMCLLVLLPCFCLSSNSKSTPQLLHFKHTVMRIAINPL
jgi:hypothetical protein